MSLRDVMWLKKGDILRPSNYAENTSAERARSLISLTHRGFQHFEAIKRNIIIYNLLPSGQRILFFESYHVPLFFL